jgi:hypothetical protein
VRVEALENSISEIKYDIKDIKSFRWTDFLWHIGVLIAFGVGFGVALITVYFRLEDRISALSTASTRIETKLEDLLARVPHVPIPLQK